MKWLRKEVLVECIQKAAGSLYLSLTSGQVDCICYLLLSNKDSPWLRSFLSDFLERTLSLCEEWSFCSPQRYGTTTVPPTQSRTQPHHQLTILRAVPQFVNRWSATSNFQFTKLAPQRPTRSVLSLKCTRKPWTTCIEDEHFYELVLSIRNDSLHNM